MKLQRLKETQKLYPLWLDKNYDSNFTKHLRVVNEQNLDLYNSLKKLEYARLLEKPIQIIKKQSEPYVSEITFRTNIPYLKNIIIYRNPTFEEKESYIGDYRLNYEIEGKPLAVISFEEDDVNSYQYVFKYGWYKDFDGYYNEENGCFYEDSSCTIEITPIKNKHYHDITSGEYYEYTGDNYEIINKEIIPSDVFLIQIETWDNYLFMKGYPENDTNDYQVDISHQKIGDRDVLTFTCFAKNIKTLSVSRNDGVILLDRTYEVGRNRFRYNYRLDVEEHIDDYIYSINIELYDGTILTKQYPESISDYNNLFNHDASLDLIGNILNVPRHIYNKVQEDELSKTLPPFNNNLSEDDYYYQERIKYYITHYNKTYFPVLEVWKYYGVQSNLFNRYHIIAEQDYSNQATNLDDYIHSTENLEYNILPYVANAYYYYDDKFKKYEDDDRVNGYYLLSSTDGTEVLGTGNIDENLYYYVSEIIYNTENDSEREAFIEAHLDKFHKFNDETEEFDIVTENIGEKTFTGSGETIITESTRTVDGEVVTIETIPIQQESTYVFAGITEKDISECEDGYDEDFNPIYKYKNPITTTIEYYDEKSDLIQSESFEIIKKGDFIKELTTPTYATQCKIILKYEDNFTYKNLSLKRVIITSNREYMRTRTDYNSCVYDLEIDYENIPTNLRLPTTTEFDQIFKRCFPISKKGILNIDLTSTIKKEEINIQSNPIISISNLIKQSERSYTGSGTSSQTKYYQNTTSMISVNPQTDYVLSFTSNPNINKIECKIDFYSSSSSTTSKQQITTGSNITITGEKEGTYELTFKSPNYSYCKITLNTADTGSSWWHTHDKLNYHNLKLYKKEQDNLIRGE